MAIVRKEFYFDSSDNINKIYGCFWLDDSVSEYKGIVQIAHGMSEHILRYERFAVFLVKNNFIVCGNDHLGHGRSALSNEELGFFGEEEENWHHILNDMKTLMNTAKARFGTGLAYFILGHSMGSFLARQFVFDFGESISGAAFLGTSGEHKLIDAGIAYVERCINEKGGKTRGEDLNKLAVIVFNMKLLPNKTDYDWLSTKADEVDKFVNDERCAFSFTYYGFRDLLGLLKTVSAKKWAEGIRKDLPMFLLSGSKDPVGDYGKGVEWVFKSLIENGCKNVRIKIYDGLRHEILNDKRSKTVYNDILGWLNFVCGKNSTH